MPIVRKRIDNAKIDTVLSNSFGFGGTNATLVFQRYPLSVANPKFVSLWSSAPSEFRIQSHTSKLLDDLSIFFAFEVPQRDAIQIAGTSNPPH